MEKIVTFISYQRINDKDTRTSIALALREIGITPLFDTNDIPFGIDFRKKLSDMLHDCDCVIVPMSSLGSQEVISELIIANERKKTILVLAKEQEPHQLPACLYFLQNNNRIGYKDMDHLQDSLKKYFSSKEKKDFNSLPLELDEISKTIKSIIEQPNFTSHLVKKILGEALNEIKSIERVEYKINVGIEKNFLVRARSLFESASEVYAFSFDKVSSFWTNEKNKPLAREYIQHQPKNTMRVFVFSSPKEANNYKKILQASHSRYGKDGGVFICSKGSYEALLKKVFPQNQLKRYLDQDFAILKYNYNGSETVVEAQFDDAELRFSKLNLTNDTYYQSLLEIFRELKELSPTQVYDGDTPAIRIKRWNPVCLDKKEIWKNELLKLFPEKIGGGVYHLVHFKKLNKEKEKVLFEIKNKLTENQDELKIRGVWFGRKTIGPPANDPTFKGQLKISDEYDYLLVVKFDSYNELLLYYNSTVHSGIRHKLYARMSDGLHILYKLLNNVSLNDKDNGELFENVIEELVSNNMVRQDFVESIDIDSIVSDPAYDFWYMVDQ